jgi:hypothetical protein
MNELLISASFNRSYSRKSSNSSQSAAQCKTKAGFRAGGQYVDSIFTAAGHDSLAPIYNKAMIFINSDQACTYEFQQSTDNVTFFTTHTEALTANSFFNVEENLVARYWRVKVTNGATAQTSFKVYSRMRS